MATVPNTPEDAQPKRSLVLTVTALFEGLTYADLKKFVAMAEAEGVQGTEEVYLSYENDDPYSPVGFEFYSGVR